MEELNVSYSYTPETWSQDRFMSFGGFSVVFLNYNKQAQIERSVASALNQDFPLLEMFFMDDASSDGSGDAMEKQVRAYRGRHKVTVIRNNHNRGITGQWNIVSKIATGEWLGMFCADDIAHLDRVSTAAKLIKETPSLKGLCTSGREYDFSLSKKGRRIGNVEEDIFESGDLRASDIIMRRTPIAGATAFWHKSLFSRELPRVPYDDILLRWVLQVTEKNNSKPVWMWAWNKQTILYGTDSGISAAARPKVEGAMSEWDKWMANERAAEKYNAMLLATWRGIQLYFKDVNAPLEMQLVARGEVIKFDFSCTPKIKRWGAVLNVLKIVSHKELSYEYKKHLIKKWVRSTFVLFFGLKMAAFAACAKHRLSGRSYSDFLASEIK